LREGARYYLIGASFWELDWAKALEYFNQVAGYGLWDGTMTVSERIYFASMRYGDQLVSEERWCDAVPQYEAAQAIAALDAAAQEDMNGLIECYPATETYSSKLTPPTGVTDTPQAASQPIRHAYSPAAPPTDTPTPTATTAS
jgi:hypothetical protein